MREESRSGSKDCGVASWTGTYEVGSRATIIRTMGGSRCESPGVGVKKGSSQMSAAQYERMFHRLLIIVMLATTFGVGGASRASAAATAIPEGQGTTGATFRNEIPPTIPGSAQRVESFADPSIIKAKDGFYYAYATKDPRFDGDTFHVIPIIRSNDLVNWTYVGDAFPNGNPPSADPSAGIFAPDIRYINDQYYLYYSITNVAGTTTNTFGTPGGDDSAIGVATSSNPAGPFTDRGIVVEPTTNPCCPPGPGNPSFFRATIDPAILPLPDGRRLIYYGSYNGGLDVRELTSDGLRTVPGTQRRIAIDNRYEGPFVVKRGQYYYMFVSATDCCNFELTGYLVFAGRSTSPFGPFQDREGKSFLDTRTGGEIALVQNGNQFVGVGHNAVITDDTGQDYIVYHGIDQRNPEIIERSGIPINRRSLMMDRLDYINGFPVARAGAGPSNTAQPAPVTRGVVDDEFNRTTGVGASFTQIGGKWTIFDPAGTNRGAVRQNWAGTKSALLISDGSTTVNYRAEGDLRLNRLGTATPRRYGLITSYIDKNNFIAAYLQPNADGMGGSLVTNIRTNGINSFKTTALPANFKHRDFHNISVTKRGHQVRFELTESRLEDPIEIQERQLPLPTQQGVALGAGRVGFATQNVSADFDNISAARLFTPVTRLVPNDARGTREERYSDEFNGNLDPENGWSYAQGRQPDPGQTSLTQRPGYYRQRTDAREITGDNPPPEDRTRILIQNAPAGDFTVDVKLDFQLPDDGSIFNFQQAGLFIYENDDKYVRLDHVAIFNTRQIEFGKEKPDRNGGDNPPRERQFGGTVLQEPAQVTILRIVARSGAGGAQTYRAYRSIDNGRTFERGGTWTFGKTNNPGDGPMYNRKIGITAFGAQDPGQPRFNADFDYVRVYRP